MAANVSIFFIFMDFYLRVVDVVPVVLVALLPVLRVVPVPVLRVVVEVLPELLVAELPELLLVAVELELPLRTVDCWPEAVVVLVLVLLLPEDCTRLDVVDEPLVAVLLEDVLRLALPVLDELVPEPLVALDPVVVDVPLVALDPEDVEVPLVALVPVVAEVPLVAEEPEELVVPRVALLPLVLLVPLVADALLDEMPRVADVVVVFVASYAILTSYALAWVLAFSARVTAELFTATLALRTVNERSGYCLP